MILFLVIFSMCYLCPLFSPFSLIQSHRFFLYNNLLYFLNAAQLDVHATHFLRTTRPTWFRIRYPLPAIRLGRASKASLAARLAERAPGAKLLLLAGVGHRAWAQEPDEWCARVLDFLDAA